MARFTAAYISLRESFMMFTHQHSYDAFQAWWNGDFPFLVEAWEFLDSREREDRMNSISKTFRLLADCTDWKESVPYFYNEALGDPDRTLSHFFPEIQGVWEEDNLPF